MFEFQIICDVFVAFLLSRMRSARTYSVRKNTGFKILMVLHVLRTSENENIVFVMPPSSMCLYPRIYNA
jgi:predicted metalloprotease